MDKFLSRLIAGLKEGGRCAGNCYCLRVETAKQLHRKIRNKKLEMRNEIYILSTTSIYNRPMRLYCETHI